MLAITLNSGIVHAAVASLSVLCSLFATGCAEAQSTRPGPSAGKGVAVVELFTSEGCSSCPPADAVLEKLAVEAREKGLAVYPVAYHVDYWDRLGWKDPFASAAATDRQRAYAAALRPDGLYTPQMVVNGRVEFVGSDAARARREIESALATAAPTKINLRAARGEEGDVTIDYAVEHAPPESTLTFVAIAAEATSVVKRGENAGRTLRHANVAVAIHATQLDSKSSGQATLKLPASPRATAVVAIVQHRTDKTISGAAAFELR